MSAHGVRAAAREGEADKSRVCCPQISPAVEAALPNAGHPYLRIFADDLAAGKAISLIITLVSDW